MKRFSLILLPLLVLAATAGCFLWRWPATLRNVVEDSWWINLPDRPRYIAWPQFDRNRERLYKIEQLTDECRWREMLPLAKSLMKDLVRSQNDDERYLAALAMRYALLAESCLGTLPYNIQHYPIREPEEFTMFRDQGRDACLFNAFFFRQLNLPDEVFHQAMEYPQNFTYCTRRSIRLQTEAAYESGDTLVARKLACIAGEQPKQSTNQEKIPYRSEVFVFGDPMIKLFVAMLENDLGNRRLFDYTALSFCLMGTPEKCMQLHRLTSAYTDETLPPVYRMKQN